MAISFKPYYKSDNLIGEGAVKFRPYTGTNVRTLTAGTYKWKSTLSGTWLGTIYNYKPLAEFSFNSNGKSFQKIMQVRNSANDHQQMQYWSPAYLAYDFTTGSWDNAAYQTITLTTDQEVSVDFYNWAITEGNLVKESAVGT